MAGYTYELMLTWGKKISDRLSNKERFNDICKDMKLPDNIAQAALNIYKKFEKKYVTKH